MGFFKHVSENSPFVPSASMTNATADILNAQRLPVPKHQTKQGTKHQGSIRVKNVSGVTVLPFQPLILGNLLVLPDASNVPNGYYCFEATLPAQESALSKRNLCIAVSPMDADEYGTAIVAGLAVARVEKVSSEHQYVEWKGPGDDALQSAESGIARILHQSDSWVVSKADDTPLMLLHLGAGSASSASAVYPVKVLSGNSQYGYTVEIYADGINQSPTGTALVFLPEASVGVELDEGTCLLAYLSSSTLIGGSDE